MSCLSPNSLKRTYDFFSGYIPDSFKIAEKEDLTLQLPLEISLEIISYLNEEKDIDALSLVNRRFNELTAEADYWKQLLNKNDCSPIESTTLRDSAIASYTNKTYHRHIQSFSRPRNDCPIDMTNYRYTSYLIEGYLRSPMKTAYENGEEIMSRFVSTPNEKLSFYPISNKEITKLRQKLLKKIAIKLIKSRKPEDARKLLFNFYAEKPIECDQFGKVKHLEDILFEYDIEEILTQLHANPAIMCERSFLIKKAISRCNLSFFR